MRDRGHPPAAEIEKTIDSKIGFDGRKGISDKVDA